jgi:hypothetical protein
MGDQPVRFAWHKALPLPVGICPAAMATAIGSIWSAASGRAGFVIASLDSVKVRVNRKNGNSVTIEK